MTHFLWQADLIAGGRILFPAPDARIAYVDPRDVADVAVSVLTGESSLDGAHAVTGREALSFAQVAERLSRKLGITMKYEEATADSFRARVLGQGGSEWLADGLLEILLDLQRRGQMPVARWQTQSRFGSARAKSRSTRSGAEARLGSRIVVRPPPRLPSAPRMPSCRISRATRFLPTRIQSPSLSSEYTLGAP
jgi:hypothetical protein